MQKRRHYSEEFKQEAVRLALQDGTSQAKVAHDLGVNSNLLNRWVSEAMKRDRTASEAVSADCLDAATLQKQLNEVTMERDILKKALVSSMDHCNTFLLILNDGGFINGTNGTAWTYPGRQGGGLATVESRRIISGHRPGVRQSRRIDLWCDSVMRWVYPRSAEAVATSIDAKRARGDLARCLRGTFDTINCPPNKSCALDGFSRTCAQRRNSAVPSAPSR